MKMTGALWRGVGFCLVAAGVASCASAPKAPEQARRGDYSSITPYLADYIQHEMKKAGVVGASVALVDDQRVVWSQGFGHANKEKNIPATPETIYRIGSITKLFTGTLAMQQAERGKLDIDAPIQRYLPGFGVRSRFGDQAPITARNLMSHHSGLPREYMPAYSSRPQSTALPADVKGLHAILPPNQMFSYSNLGGWALGEAVGRAAGKDYASLLQSELLQPLGMNHSYLAQGLLPDGSSMLSAQARNALDDTAISRAYENGDEVQEFYLRSLPSGALNSNVTDMAQFMKMVFADGRAQDRQIIGAATLAEMLKPQNVDAPLNRGYPVLGLGWMLDKAFSSQEPVITHGGEMHAHNSMLFMLPKQKLGVIVLTNSAEAGQEAFMPNVVKESLMLGMEVKTGKKPVPMPPRSVAAERPWTEADRKKVEGAYATMAGYVRVKPAGDGMQAEVAGKSLELFPREDGSFGLRYRMLGLFSVGEDTLGRMGILRETWNGRELVSMTNSARDGSPVIGERIQPTPIPASWQRRVGEYELDSPKDLFHKFSEIRVLEQDGFLMLRYGFEDEEGTVTRPLRALSDEEAVMLGIGPEQGETIRMEQGADGRERFRYGGMLFRRKAGDAS
ncbi:MAG: serine hydrolase domain-containing protein [Lautropia sp.]|nr:serine hydrolase domain-containing protein [Lautropia sp.]